MVPSTVPEAAGALPTASPEVQPASTNRRVAAAALCSPLGPVHLGCEVFGLVGLLLRRRVRFWTSPLLVAAGTLTDHHHRCHRRRDSGTSWRGEGALAAQTA